MISDSEHYPGDSWGHLISEPTHVHQHTIPVEWMHKPLPIEDSQGAEGAVLTNMILSQPIVVTKLRCICGDEINRDSK